MSKFKRLTAEQVAKLSAEEKEAYYLGLDQEYTTLEQNNTELKKENSDFKDVNDQLTTELNSKTELASGKVVKNYNGKKYQVSGKFHFIKLKGDVRRSYTVDQILANDADGKKLRDHLINIKSGILVEIED